VQRCRIRLGVRPRLHASRDTIRDTNCRQPDVLGAAGGADNATPAAWRCVSRPRRSHFLSAGRGFEGQTAPLPGRENIPSSTGWFDTDRLSARVPPAAERPPRACPGPTMMVSAHAMGCAMNSRQLAMCQRARGGETASEVGYRGSRLPSQPPYEGGSACSILPGMSTPSASCFARPTTSSIRARIAAGSSRSHRRRGTL